MEKDYKISIKRGDKEYKLHLSAGMFTLGVAGFAVGAMLFVVAATRFSTYLTGKKISTI